MSRKTLAEVPDVQQPFWGAHASGVSAIAFCDRELPNPWATRVELQGKQSSLPQNAATSTLEACAPQNSCEHHRAD